MKQMLSAQLLSGVTAALVWAAPAASQSILGLWQCQDQDTEGHARSIVEFKKNGTMLADMHITYNVPGFDVQARAKYRSRYTLSDDGVLQDTPTRARIVSFTADGEDISRSEEAKMLKAYLMQDDSVKAKVTTLTNTDLVINAAERDIVCQRVKRVEGS